MANSGDAWILNGLLTARGRGRGRGLCPLVRQLPNDAAVPVLSDFLFTAAAAGGGGPAGMKGWDGLATANIKNMTGLAIASVKTWEGLA